jgi:putative chitinase
MKLTLAQLKTCCPASTNSQVLLDAINTVLPKYNIVTADEVAAFLSQCGHESVDFTRLEENLMYSADALHRTWPRRFVDDATCIAYAKHPQKIANKVYADRMGNGNEASGDGWLYHGRGAVQLTGKDNYSAFAKYKGKPLETIGAYLLTIEGAIDSACWFWTINNLNVYADKDDVEGLTRKINGGTLGLDARKAKFAICLSTLKM